MTIDKIEAKTIISKQSDEINELANKVKGLIELYKDVVISEARLEERVKKLEQRNSYYPMKEEIRGFKLGGTVG